MKQQKDKSMTRRRKKCVETAKKIIKIRDRYTCQHCHKIVSGVNCQGSHVIPESKNKKLSCDLSNIKVLCYQCHVWWHENPIESAKRFAQAFPQRLQYLQEEQKIVNGSIGIQYFIDKLEELKQTLEKIS